MALTALGEVSTQLITPGLGPQRIVATGVTLVAIGGVSAMVIYELFGLSMIFIQASFAVSAFVAFHLLRQRQVKALSYT